jgi:hypothetical protein
MTFSNYNLNTSLNADGPSCGHIFRSRIGYSSMNLRRKVTKWYRRHTQNKSGNACLRKLWAAHYSSYLMNDDFNPHLGKSDLYLVVAERVRYSFSEI